MRALLASLALLSACSEPVLVKFDEPPIVTIQQPGEGAEVPQGEPVSFVGRVADDGPEDQLTLTWIDNGTNILIAETSPDDEGYNTLTTADLSPGAHAITLRAVDPSNLSGEASVTVTVVTVVESPSITIVHPVSGDRAQQDAEFLFEATVTDPQDEATALLVEVESELDGFLCSLDVNVDGNGTCLSRLQTVGTHRITFTVTDTDGNEARRTASLPVDAVAQVPTIVVTTPASGSTVRQDVVLQFLATVADVQNAPTSLAASVTSDRDGRVCDLVVDGAGSATCFASLSTIGNHLLTWSVTDLDLNMGSQVILVRVSDGSDIDDDGDGFTEVGGDCNDADRAVYPGATEQPNGRDDDCDLTADEGTILFDDDGDGSCESTTTPCTDGTNLGDCNDQSGFVGPHVGEVCNDGVDNNCSGAQNEPGAQACIELWYDGDRDTYGVAGNSQCLCAPAQPYTALNDDDCNDSLASVNPGAPETPDALDNNCNTVADEGTSLFDDDGDGYCDTQVGSCTDGSQPGDCNDAAPTVNPGEAEVCRDGVDNNCAGGQDEEGALGCIAYWLDGDGDNFGDATRPACACTPPPNAVYNDDDCDDATYSTNPSAGEAPDGLDNDCDGLRDEGTDRYDNDGDGYCRATSCTTQANGTTAQGGDCNDANAQVSPGAPEVCNDGADNNCNTLQNEGENAAGCLNFYRDQDGDGFGAGASKCYCAGTGLFTAQSTNDCYDSNRNAFPGQSQWFTGQRGDGSFDYDCDGSSQKRWVGEYECKCTIFFGPIPIVVEPFEPGWDNEPACGVSDVWYTYCEYPNVDADLGICIPINPAVSSTINRTQECK